MSEWADHTPSIRRLEPGSHTFTVRYFIKGPPVIRFGDSDRPRPITIPVIKDDMG